MVKRIVAGAFAASLIGSAAPHRAQCWASLRWRFRGDNRWEDMVRGQQQLLSDRLYPEGRGWMITTLIADEEVVPTYTGWGTCTTKGGTQTTIWKTGQVHGTRLHRWSMARDEEAWEQEKITDVDVPGGFTGWGYCTTQGGGP